MNTIWFELYKKFNDWWYLKNIKTDLCINVTLGEAIEFLSEKWSFIIEYKKSKIDRKYFYIIKIEEKVIWSGKTLFEAIEETLKYLLDNNLFTKK